MAGQLQPTGPCRLTECDDLRPGVCDAGRHLCEHTDWDEHGQDTGTAWCDHECLLWDPDGLVGVNSTTMLPCQSTDMEDMDDESVCHACADSGTATTSWLREQMGVPQEVEA